MSRTDLDAVTLANSLRMKAGDGSIEWVSEPIQASVLLDIADMLDENVKLKQELEAVGTAAYLYGRNDLSDENAKLREYIERKKVLQDYARLFDNNVKLRELCAGLLTGYECGRGKLCKGCTWDGLGDPKTFPCLPRVKARELGIEVPE